MSTKINIGTPALVITYATTQDNFDGSPWPPDGGDDFWAIVAPVGDGRTIWRRIVLTKTAKGKKHERANGIWHHPGNQTTNDRI